MITYVGSLEGKVKKTVRSSRYMFWSVIYIFYIITASAEQVHTLLGIVVPIPSTITTFNFKGLLFMFIFMFMFI